MSKMPYDPYTMRIKEIKELIPELSKLLMSRLGTPATQALWGVFCEASRMHAEAMPDPDDEAEAGKSDFRTGRDIGQSYAAHVVIRKIADGMGVDNFKLREVPLEPPNVQGDQQVRLPDPGEEDPPG